MMQIATMKAEPWQSNTNALPVALIIAALTHTVLLLGIDFKLPHTAQVQPAIALTLTHASLPAAEIAPLVAPEAGPPTTDRPVAAPTSPIERQSHKPAVRPRPPIADKPSAAAPSAKERMAAEPAEAAPAAKPLLTAETLQQQISQLGEQIRNRSQPAHAAKIKLVSTVTGHKFLAEQYVKDWGDKVERTGNLNYPEAARNKGEAQTLTMEVGINADGGIYSMHIIKSSGNPKLDEAAKRIVEMSAPFAALPYDLLQEVNVLVITRVWKFSDQTGMTSR